MNPALVRLRGRGSEAAALTTLLDEARSGRGAALAVTGGPGTGKSALLAHVRAAAHGMTVVRAAGTRAETDLAYAGLHQLLRPLADQVARLPAEQAEVLAAALRTGRVAREDVLTLSAACLGVLSLAGHATPLLCCVDDAHLLDPASLEALAFAARRVDGEPVAVVLAARDDGGEPPVPGVPPLCLPPLADRDVHALLADAADTPVAAGVRDAVTRAAHGNPRAALGYVAALDAGQLAGSTPLPDPLPLEASLRRALVARVASLPPEARELVLLAAADPEADVDLLARAAQGPTVSVAALAPAEEAEVLRVRGDRPEFRDPLLAEAVYQDAPIARRRAAHARLARAVDRHRDPTRYARHRAAATRRPTPGLAADLAGAAVRSRALDGHAAAATVLERAAELTPSPRCRARRLAGAAHDAWLGGLADRAAALLERARPLATPDLTGVIDLVSGEIGVRGGNALDAADTLLAAADRLAGHDRRLAARALVLAANAASLAGDRARHAAAAERGAPLFGADDPPELRLARSFLEGCQASFDGRYADSVAPLRRTVELAGDVDRPEELVWASIAALRLGDAPGVHGLATRAARAARRSGARSVVPLALEFLVYAEFWTGRFPSAIGNGMAGLRLAREGGQPNSATHLLASLTLLAAIQGDVETCRERARGVVEEAQRNSLGLPAALAGWALAVLDLSLGNAAGAFSRLRILAHADPGYGHPTMRLLTAPLFVEAAVRVGEPDRAATVLAPYREWAEATGSVSTLALAARCRGLLAPPEEAAEHYEEALRLHRASADDDVERARTTLLYGTALRRGRLPGRAREYLRAALATFERIGARLWADQARTELRANGEPDPRGAPVESAELTAQQRQIALLVAEGATNREVAAHLFISARTVEHHLRGIFRKLNIRSRVELARVFR